MVERINTNLSVEDFERLHLATNKPCIFQEKFTAEWRSRQNWVKEGKPNYSYLKKHFGRSKVPVANCSQQFHNAHCKNEMQFGDFVNYWKSLSETTNREESPELLYLKDWHFQREYPEYRAYEVLDYFKSDWLNEFYDDIDDKVADDYRFVYMGPQGTWTAFHADVFRSYSWSANICGRKKWILYPPGEEENLKDIMGNLPFDVTMEEMNDRKKFPNAEKTCEPIVLIQEEGEVVFVPSGWHHQVHNLEDTISINHNWTNAYGIDFMFKHLKTELSLVEKEIEEHRGTDGWQEQCQLILKCSAGMDFKGFYRMITLLVKPRIKLLDKSLEAQEKPFESKDDDSTLLFNILESFKRIDITCVPREHLQYDVSGMEKSKSCRSNDSDKLLEILQNRTKRVKLDLKKLIENFRNLCKVASSDEEFIEGLCLVSDIETTLNNV